MRGLTRLTVNGVALSLALVCASCSRRPTTSEVRDASVGQTSGEGGIASESSPDGGPPLEFVGVVRGIVKLAEGAELPLAPPPTVQGLPPVSVPPCLPIDVSDRRTISQAASGGLFPVHLAVTGQSASPPHTPQTHEVFIDACRLRPTLVGAMRGDHVRLTNRSESAMLPSIPGESFVRGLLRGESREFTLKQTQTVLRCGFGNWCGESLIVAVTHPLYAVTDAEGHFTIERVPLDQDLTLHAWHPLFVVSSAPFKLTHDHPEHTVDLLLTPNPRVIAKPDAGVAPGADSAKSGTKPRGQASPGKRAPDPEPDSRLREFH